eukprot:gene13195-20382_t
MKIKCLSRTSRDHTKDRGSDVSRVHRNLDPKLHPFDRQIEYKRAVTAAKLDRMFAKPFVAAFDGHIDTVCALAKDPSTPAMKIKCLSRASRDHTKDRGSDVSRVHRNLDPKLHPFDRQIEYKRAVTAAKLDRMFAKPFVAAFDGHIDTVCALAKDPSSLSHVVSGGFDGEVRLWNIQKREMCHKVVAHRGAVSGLVVAPDGSAYLSCSADKAVRLWDMDGNNQVDAHGEARPLAEYLGDRPFSSIDHHWVKSMFVTAGSNLELWDVSRQRPISTFNWGIDQVTKCRFNKS